jgi:hypothetical protein
LKQQSLSDLTVNYSGIIHPTIKNGFVQVGQIIGNVDSNETSELCTSDASTDVLEAKESHWTDAAKELAANSVYQRII